MRDKLKEIRSQVTGVYLEKYYELYDKLADERESIAEDTAQVQLEQATLISGHIYAKRLASVKIAELCKLRL